MGYQLPPLNWLRAFEATARLSSFTAAGEELCLTQPAVSYQVRSLEDRLGFKLFDRQPRNLMLTDMGEAYLPRVQQAFADLAATTVGLFGKPGERFVTVRAPLSTTALWIGPRLHTFQQAYPDIEIRLCSFVWAENLTAEEIDVDIRFGTGNWSGYKIQLITNEVAVPVCSAKESEPPTRLADFRHRSLIHIMGYQDYWMRFFRAHDLEADNILTGMRVDTSHTAIEMVTRNLGDAMLPKRIAEPAVAEGRLQIPVDLELPLDEAYYFLVPDDDTQRKPEANLFCEWMMDELRDEQAQSGV